ncbi:MAG: O-antigen ligase family protein [Planctomycetes bacterium]|nr:O-antigen ligase family protein [Planctomycetota bacterium]
MSSRRHQTARSHRKRSDVENGASFDRSVTRLVDIGLFGAIFAVPFAMGGRTATGQLVLTIVAGWVAGFWLLRQMICSRPTWRVTGLEILLILAAALGLLQITELPNSWINLLSPHISKLLPGWSDDNPSQLLANGWNHLSLTLGATRSALVSLIAVGLIAVVASQRIERPQDAERLMRWICLAAASMAAFALVQYFASNGKFFWVFEHPYSTTADRLKGAFTNRNHFAHFLVLSVGPLLWWIIRFLENRRRCSEAAFTCSERPATGDDSRLALLLLTLALVIASVLFSLSRGGIVALFIAMLFCVGALFRKGVASGKLLWALAGVGGLCLGMLLMLGTERLSKRLDNWQSDDRLRIWKANLDIARDFPVTGAGLASHREIYPIYLDQAFDNREYTHAENSYLQIAAEMGLPGLALALMAVLLCSYWCLAGLRLADSREIAAPLAAVTGSLAASAAHAFVDFIWYVPGCMVITGVLAACACRFCHFAREAQMPECDRTAFSGVRLPRWAAAAAFGGLVAVTTWMLQIKLPSALAEPHWMAYLRLVHEKDDEPEASADSSDELARLRRKLIKLRATVCLDPSNSRAQLRMAAGYLSWFHVAQQHAENPMTLLQIRDAAWASQFASATELSDWLGRALGPNRRYLDKALFHAQRALSLCPLQGEGYLYLADLDFLQGTGPAVKEAWLSQALTVRPYHPEVLFALGRDAWFVGDIQTALRYWRGAFHRDRDYQQRIVDILIDFVPARFLVEAFHPDWEALQWLEERFRSLQRPEDHQYLLQTLAEAAVAEAKRPGNRRPVVHWLVAAKAFAQLGDDLRAEECFTAALDADPNSFHVHRDYGFWLLKHDRFADAAEHLVWASRLRPKDERVRAAAERANLAKLRVAGPARSADAAMR